jgi:hypothetical protein
VGSLNIRHFYVEQRLKARFPVAPDRFWFRFRHLRHQGLERDDQRAEVEFEYSPRPLWYVSLMGDTMFHKSEASAGLALRWGPSEGRSVKLAYLWPDFDTNYSFGNRSVNEGFESYYRRFPQEARLSAVWTGPPWSARLEGRHVRNWERERREFSAPGERTVSRGGDFEALLDLRWRRGPWTWAVEGEAWRSKESIAFEPSRPAEDRSLLHERGLFRVAAQRRLGPALALRAGAAGAGLRGRLGHALDPSRDQGYRIRDRIFSVGITRVLRGGLKLDGEYLYDRQFWKTGAGPSEVGDDRSHNRGKLALQHDFANGSSFRLIGAAELDQGEAERFFSFDGATAQFQTAF